MRSRRALAGSLSMAILLVIALAAPVWAQDDDEDPFAGLYGKSSFYLIAMGNYMIPTQTSDIEHTANRRLDALFGPGTTTDVNNSWGLNGRAGYRAFERFAVETQFEWLNDIELDHRLGTLMKQNTEISMLALTANAKGYLAGTGRVQPYLLAGAGWGRATTNPGGAGAKSRDDGFLYRFGAGVELYGKPDIALTLEASYVIPTGNIDDLQYVSIGGGLMLRFFPGGY
jgi:opacity protein-like surface antigen